MWALLLLTIWSVVASSDGSFSPEDVLSILENSKEKSEIPLKSAEDIRILVDVGSDIWAALSQIAALRSITFTRDTNFRCTEEMNKVVIIDFSAESDLLNRVENASTFGSSCFWLFSASNGNLQRLEELRPRYDSRVYAAQKTESQLDIYEVYSLAEGWNVTRPLVETWNGSRAITPHEFVWERRRDLTGLTFTAGIFNYIPYSIVPDKTDLASATGFNMDVLKYLRLKMNFDVVFKHPSQGNFGRADERGNWNGVVGMCQRKEIDFSSTLIKVTQARAQVVKYGQVVTTHRNVFVTQAGSIDSANSIFTMLNTDVWIVSAVTALIMMILAVLIGRMLRESGEDSDSGRLALITFGFFFLQGAAEEPTKSTAMRLIALSCLIFGFLTVNVFSAFLTSFISVRIETGKINSIEDIEKFGLNLFVLGGTATLDTFSKALPGTVERRMYEDQIKTDTRFTPPNPNAMIDAFVAELDSGTPAAMLINPQQILYWIDENRNIGCSFNRLGRNAKLRFAIPARKDFPYMDAFNYQLTKFKESGLIAKAKRKWIWPLDKSTEFMCSSYNWETALALDGVGFDTIDTLFLFLGVGSVIGLALAGVENLLALGKRNVKSKKAPIRQKRRKKSAHRNVKLEDLVFLSTVKFASR